MSPLRLELCLFSQFFEALTAFRIPTPIAYAGDRCASVRPSELATRVRCKLAASSSHWEQADSKCLGSKEA